MPCTNHSSLVNSDFHCAGTRSLLGLSAIVVTPFHRRFLRVLPRLLVCPARTPQIPCQLLLALVLCVSAGLVTIIGLL